MWNKPQMNKPKTVIRSCKEASSSQCSCAIGHVTSNCPFIQQAEHGWALGVGRTPYGALRVAPMWAKAGKGNLHGRDKPQWLLRGNPASSPIRGRKERRTEFKSDIHIVTSSRPCFGRASNICPKSVGRVRGVPEPEVKASVALPVTTPGKPMLLWRWIKLPFSLSLFI